MSRRFHFGSDLEPPRETTVASLTLKGISDDLLRRLRRAAEENRRSLNREVLDRLARTVETRPIDPETLLARADALRERLSLPPLSDAAIQRAKRSGRS
jgi:antitoxin FitA-like protein